MNRSSLKKGRKGSVKRRGKRSSKKTDYQKWLSDIERLHGGIRQGNSSNLKQIVVPYTGYGPQYMPSPGGPSPGAHFTCVNLVRGSDMTLPTGTAIVGALLRQSSASDVFASYAFALADIPNIASLSALFDQYRIEEIQLRFRTRNPAVYIAPTASPNYSTATPFIAVDRDDNTAPTTIGEVQQYDNCVNIAAQDSLDIVFQPSITPSVFSGGAFSGYGVSDSGSMWLDMANTGIPHYGVKVAIPALVATTTQRFDWDVTAKYKVSFLNTR